MPAVSVRISQERLTDLLKFTASEWVPELNIVLDPVHNRFDLFGRVKGKLYQYTILEKRHEEHYPQGMLFHLRFGIELLSDRTLHIIADRLDLFEREGMVTIYDRPKGQSDLVIETLLWLLKLIPEPERYFSTVEAAAEPGVLKCQLQKNILSQFLDHPEVEKLELWSLSPVIDVDMHKFALEIALGKGDRSSFDHYKEVRQRPYRFFKEFEKETPMHVKFSASIEGMNDFMEALLPYMNSTESQTAFQQKKEDAWLLEKIRFEMFADPKASGPEALRSKLQVTVGMRQWETDNWGWRFPPWSTFQVEKPSQFMLEARLGVHDQNSIGEDLTALEFYNISLKGTFLSAIKFFTKWIIPRIDDPSDDNEKINRFVKLFSTQDSQALIEVSRRVSLPWLDFILQEVRLRHEQKEISVLGDVVFPLTSIEIQSLNQLERVEEVDVLYTAHPQSTVTGLEHMRFLYAYALLYYKMHHVSGQHDHGFCERLYVQKIKPLMTLYEKEYQALNQSILKEKTFWTEYLFDDAQQSQSFYDQARLYTQ